MANTEGKGRPLDEVFEEASTTTEKEQELEQQKEEIKQKLTDKVEELQEEGEINENEVRDIREDIRHDNFDRAREQLSEALQELKFEEEEKQLFADQFAEEYEAMTSNIEQMKNSLLDLESKYERDDIIAYLFGKHNSLRKTDIRKTINGISELSDKTFTTNDQAELISSFTDDLNKSDAEDVLKKLKEEA